MQTANPPSPGSSSRASAFMDLREPSLAELYGDPVLHAMLRRDGIDLSALKAVVANAQKRLAA
ncbi:hypothetical protein [Oleispirillum naphthae]|uniref:hypothetical protein n=1 Tax=Oleispirillum naphthae TaxID=2838853 RepID=UPI003082554C